MKVVILCAGYATRLHPYTLDSPKPLLDVNSKPLLNYTIDKLNEVEGIDKIYIVTNNKFYQTFLDWNKEEKIEIINDLTNSNEERLGGVMDFALALDKIDDDVMIIFGDLYFNFSLKDFADFFNDKQRVCVALHDLNDLEKAKRFGVLEVKGDKIVGFEEKPENPKSSLVNAGAFIFPKSVIPELKEYMASNKIKENIGYIIIDLIEQGKDLRGFIFEEDWYDIGTVQDYEKIKEELKNDSRS